MNPTLIQRIKDEITNDPDHKGYSGLDAQSIANLMNQPTITKTDILQPDPVVIPIVTKPLPGTIIGQVTEVKDAPVLKLVVGIPEAANIISADEVTAALK